jgi:hypothetical protein
VHTAAETGLVRVAHRVGCVSPRPAASSTYIGYRQPVNRLLSAVRRWQSSPDRALRPLGALSSGGSARGRAHQGRRRFHRRNTHVLVSGIRFVRRRRSRPLAPSISRSMAAERWPRWRRRVPGVSPACRPAFRVMIGLSLSGAPRRLLAWDIERLVSAHVVRPSEAASAPRPTSRWRRVAILAIVFAFLAGAAYYAIGILRPFAAPGTAAVDGSVGAPYTFVYSDWATEERTVHAELRGSATTSPRRLHGIPQHHPRARCAGGVGDEPHVSDGYGRLVCRRRRTADTSERVGDSLRLVALATTALGRGGGAACRRIRLDVEFRDSRSAWDRD